MTPKMTTNEFDKIRRQIGEWLKGPCGSRLWDLMCALRGPDFPSERPDMEPAASQAAYAARRDRKYKSCEVVREAAFFGVIGGAARHHPDTKILLPPSKEWDHYDKHQARAAAVLGLEVQETERPAKKGEAKVAVKFNGEVPAPPVSVMPTYWPNTSKATPGLLSAMSAPLKLIEVTKELVKE